MDSKDLAFYLSDLILQKKGTDILILDIRKQTSMTDFFVIGTASSDTQVRAIADNIIAETKKAGQKPWHNEGYSNLSWVLLDFVDVVVHIFLKETRKFYNLEGLWGDAKITKIDEQ
jgi:ribosome-associated protein